MDSSAITSAIDAGAGTASSGAAALAPAPDVDPRASAVPRSRSSVIERSGTRSGHDVLLALIMAVAMAATVFLYR